MNNLIDRYIYDVTRRLPERERADVEKELRANIMDMLPDNPGDEDVRKVLLSLGDPAGLSGNYRSRPGYLISPELFDDYLSVIKIVVPIVALAVGVASLISGFFSEYAAGDPYALFGAVLGKTIAGVFSGVVYAAFWVTLGFAAADYCSFKRPKKEWNPDSLPEIPSPKIPRIKRAGIVAETAVSVMFCGFLAVAFSRHPQIFSWVEVKDTVRTVTPLFNADTVAGFAPYLWALAVLALISGIVKLIYGRWSWATASLQSLWQAASALFWVVFFRSAGLFNTGFLRKAADALGDKYSRVSAGWQTGVSVLCALIVIGTAIDIVKAFVYAYKTEKYR